MIKSTSISRKPQVELRLEVAGNSVPVCNTSSTSTI
jgi:hypothetical protein